MNAILEQINSAGLVFVKFALPMLVQSSILIVVLLLADLLLRKKVRAVVRYWLWMLVIIKLVLPTTLSSPVSLGSWFGDELADIKVSDTSIAEQPVNLPQIIETETATVTGTPHPDIKPTMASPSITEPIVAATPLAPLTWQGIVFLVWAAVVTAMGLLLLQRAIFVTGLVAQAQNPTQLMNDAFRFCCGQMGLKSKVGLKVSANTASPAVCGLFRPVILVPQNLAPTLGSSHLRPVLLHELAHIKRGDLWINLLQTILQIVYFYNPLLWLANSIIRRIREQAVDEAVQVAMGANAPQYPQTLVDVAKIAFNRPVLSLRLIGVVESKSALKWRIERMLNRPIPKSAKLGILGLITLLIFAAVLLPMAKAKSKPPEFIIKGTVTDAHTGRPVAGAKVGDEQYAGGKQCTTTDANGFYSYNTWYEEHNIKCEASGYKTQNKLLYTKLFGSEKEKIFDFALEPSDSPENVSDTLNQPSSNQNYNEFEAKLSNGITVELIGVCEHPSEGKQWWRPDGTTLEQAPYSSRKDTIANSNEEFNRLIEIAVGLSGADLQDVSLACEVPGATRTSVNGVDIEGLKSIACEVSKLFNSGQVNVGVAAGSWEWETIFVRKAIIEEKIEGQVVDRYLTPGHWLLENSGGFISWDVPLEKDGKASIKVAHSYGEYDSRVVARDKNGNLLTSSWSSGTGANDVRTTEYRFPVRLAQIDEFQLQIRPYQWVTFSNVSLKPGVKTDVHVEQTVGGGQQQSAEELHKLLMEHRDIFQKKLQTVEMEYNAGRAGPKQLRQAKIDLLWVESKLSETPQKRIDILEQIVNLHLEQEKAIKLLLEAGRITQDELNRLKLPRLNAEEELARAKADLEKSKSQRTNVRVEIEQAGKVDDKNKTTAGNFSAEGTSGKEPEKRMEKPQSTQQVAPGDSSSPISLQTLVNAARPGETVTIPKGVYTKPVQITKPLTLKGLSRDDCILEVTADRPAIFIDTKGKGKVTIEDVTIKWQLATSDEKIEYPFAVAVKDTKAEVKYCSFASLGNFKRCPTAIRAVGFSDLNINTCRFQGYEYTISYGEGSQGTVSDSLIADSGHQGISLYEGATVHIERNVVTGSAYHAVRSTGGTLFMKDNLIINNANRGIYLGNKSAKGTISNNIITGNETGIGGFAQSKVNIENNLILDSGYAGIGMEKSCSLVIRNNIFVNNERGWIMFDRGGNGANTCYRNTFWKNKVDAENFEKTADSITSEPRFGDPDNGNFLLNAGPALEYKQGLTNPQVFKALWKIWQNRANKNEPFASAGQSNLPAGSELEKASQTYSPLQQHNPVVLVYPPSGSKMALISELQVVFDQPMMPEEFKIIDASLEEKHQDWSDVAAVRSYVVYDANKYQFSIPLILPRNWNGSIQLSGFKTAKGVEVEPIMLNYTTSRDKFSSDLLQKFEKAQQSRELRTLLENIKNARSKLKSLSETVYYTYDFGDHEKSCKAIFKMQNRNQFYVDMSEEFEKPWHIGSDGEKCWFYSEYEDTKKLVAIDFSRIDEKKISICNPFEIAEADIDTVIKHNNIEYLGTEILDGRKYHKVRSWLVKIEHKAICSVITWWFDSETYMPAKIISDSGRWRESFRFVYDRVNEPINDSEFRPESVTKIKPQEPEPLDENYNTRYIRIIDGSSSGRMSIKWGKRGPKGTSGSGLN